MEERRRFVRFKALLEILHSNFKEQSKKGKAKLCDISKEGLRMISAEPVEEGSVLDFEMSIPGDNIPVFASGQVAWIEKLNEKSYNTGIKFSKIKNDDKARLFDHVYNEWIKESVDK